MKGTHVWISCGRTLLKLGFSARSPTHLLLVLEMGHGNVSTSRKSALESRWAGQHNTHTHTHTQYHDVQARSERDTESRQYRHRDVMRRRNCLKCLLLSRYMYAYVCFSYLDVRVVSAETRVVMS